MIRDLNCNVNYRIHEDARICTKKVNGRTRRQPVFTSYELRRYELRVFHEFRVPAVDVRFTNHESRVFTGHWSYRPAARVTIQNKNWWNPGIQDM